MKAEQERKQQHKLFLQEMELKNQQFREYMDLKFKKSGDRRKQFEDT